MRILFVAMAESVHVARWIDQLKDRGWDLHLFPFNDGRPHPDLSGVTVHRLVRETHGTGHVEQTGVPWPLPRGDSRLRNLLRRVPPLAQATRLARLIERLRPDIVHTLEMQRCGYLTCDARRTLSQFPAWIYSCWGNDIYYFRNQFDHAAQVREVLGACDYLITDCRRDLPLARECGFHGTELGVVPVGGGFDLAQMTRLRQPGPPSDRRVIALKGYQHDVFGGRSLVGLEALRRCSEFLHDYEIVVHSGWDLREKFLGSARQAGLRMTVLPASPHEEIVRLMGRARVSIGLSLTDGSPNTMLEAMIMGAFPIQSDTVSTGEWICNGENGLLVPAEDPDAIANAIRGAVQDGALVDRAAHLNEKIAAERLERRQIRAEVIAMYERVARETAVGEDRRLARGSAVPAGGY